jgi:hypothetical protein
MPVVVLAVSGRDVLICQSGKFLADKPWIENIYDLQRLDEVSANNTEKRPVQNTSNDKKLATVEFLKRAEQLTNILHNKELISYIDNVRVNGVEWKNASIQNGKQLKNRYTTRFLYSANPPGFIKGTFPDPAYPGETPQQAGAREFFEETGTRIDIVRFEQIQPTIFMLRMSSKEAEQIIPTWRALPVGELTELRWEPILEIIKDTNSLNSESRLAARFLPPVGGRKKTIRRKKLKQPKKKGTLKRGVRRSH